MYNVFIGADQRFQQAYKVAELSLIEKNVSNEVFARGLNLTHLREQGFYSRPTSGVSGDLWDDISGAPMSTEFAISRFLVPFLSSYSGWSIFCDSDFLFRSDIAKVFDLADDKYAMMCVHHDYTPKEHFKMDGQVQTQYSRKNWSSFMLFNNAHKANRFLSLKNVNSLAGRDLHRFCWLLDEEIGKLDESWNWLEGHSNPEIIPDAVHYTRGTPDMAGFEKAPYADEWRRYADR